MKRCVADIPAIPRPAERPPHPTLSPHAGRGSRAPLLASSSRRMVLPQFPMPQGPQMNDVTKKSNAPVSYAEKAWQSDVIVDLIKHYGFPYIALNPGASYRGLHDSLVN